MPPGSAPCFIGKCQEAVSFPSNQAVPVTEPPNVLDAEPAGTLVEPRRLALDHTQLSAELREGTASLHPQAMEVDRQFPPRHRRVHVGRPCHVPPSCSVDPS